MSGNPRSKVLRLHQFKVSKVEARRDRTAKEGRARTIVSGGLPSSRRNDSLGMPWGEPNLPKPSLIEHLKQCCALVQVPDLVATQHPMPAREHPGWKEEQDGRRGRPPTPGRLHRLGRPKGLSKEAPLGVRLQAMRINERQGQSFRTSST